MMTNHAEFSEATNQAEFWNMTTNQAVSWYDDNQSGEILHVTANQETFREKFTIKNMYTNLKFFAM